jgi:hypothetical protein
MRQRFRRPSPATIVALVALFAALAGSAYATGKIDGRTLKVKSLPGNRLKLGSVPANRLKPGALPTATGIVEPITGSQIDERSLGQVPSAAYADVAASAQTAIEAQTALDAVNAVNAETVNGHTAGCMAGTVPFAGACWQSSASGSAVTAPVAAAACAAQGATLPEALQLAAFSHQPDITLAPGGEWSDDIPDFSGPDTYGVVTVSPTGQIDATTSTNTRQYRCVIPIVV